MDSYIKTTPLTINMARLFFSTSYLHREHRAEILHHVANTFCTDSFAIKTETTHLQKVAYEHKQVLSCYQENCYHTKAPPNQNTPE